MIEAGALTAVHDVADGGIAVAVAEMALASNIGAMLTLPLPGGTATLFAEDQGLYVATVADPALLDVLTGGYSAGVEVERIGRTIVGRIVFELDRGDFVVKLDELRKAHEGFFPALMRTEVAA